jgi:subtilisin-like proprotein convertase family protein
MRPFVFGILSIAAAGVCWSALTAKAPTSMYLAGGKAFRAKDVAGLIKAEPRSAGLYRVTIKAEPTEAQTRLRRAGAQFILDADSEDVDRSDLESIEHHIAYLQAAFKMQGGKGETPGADFFEALEMEVRKRADQNGHLDFDAIERAANHRDQMPKAWIGVNDSGAMAPNVPWKHLGPFNAHGPFQYCYGSNNISGRKSSIAVAKTDSNTIWFTGRGGAYKSTDYGSTWTNMSAGWKFTNANSIAIDPSDKNIVYVGTGDWDDGGAFGSLPFGIMKTTDGGETWTNYGQGTTFANDECITDILIAPWNRNVLFCTTRHGNRYPDPQAPGLLYKSTNGGQTWVDTGQTSRDYTDLTNSIPFTFNNFTFQYVYAAASDGTILRTSDGTTWTPTTTSPGSGYVHIAGSKIKLGTLYATSATGRVKVSADYGDTWTDFTGSTFPTQKNGSSNWGQTSYNLYVGCTKIDSTTERIWAGNLTTATRTNVDATWVDVAKSYTDTSRAHADNHCFANDPSNDNRVYFGSDGGIYRNYANDPTLVVGLNTNIGDFQLYDIEVHPTLPDFVMCGAQDNSVMASLGNLNAWQGLDKWDGGFSVYDKNNPKIHYTTSQGGAVYKFTEDFQDSDHDADLFPTDPQLAGAAFIAPLATVGTGSEVLLGTGRMLRYPGTGTTWTTGFVAPTTIDEIATIGNNVYFGCGGGQVYYSADKGSTAVRVDGAGIPDTPIGAIYMKGTADVLVGIMGTTGGLYHSTNANGAGATWTNVSGSGATALPASPINCIAVDPNNGSRWFVGCDAGLFMTANGGSTWANCNTQGFPNVCVSDLEMKHGYLYAATAGRGAFRIKISPSIGHEISGTVIEDGNPMPNVKIRLTNQSDIEGRLSNSTGEDIPDHDTDGISSTIITLTGGHTMVTCKIFVHITHTYSGDLQIDIKGPNGVSKRLKSQGEGGSADDVVMTYDCTDVFGGISSIGAWELDVRDLVANDVGRLNTWSVIYTYAGSPTLAEAVTDASGKYNFSALLTDTYTVTPIKPGKVFVPGSRVVSMGAIDVTGQDFVSLVPFQVNTVPNTIIGGSSATGVLRMSATPESSVQVAVSDNSSATGVPSSVNTTGASTNFTITSIQVASITNSTISATFGGITKQGSITVYPVPVLASLSAGPTPIYGGTQVSGTVTLGAAAPADTTVTLTGYNPDLMPTTPTVTIPKGQISANFLANSTHVATPRTRYLKAILGSQVKSKAIFLEPDPYIAGWTFTPNPVIAGENTTGKVQLARPVVNAPVRVYLTDNSTHVTTPDYVDIPVGQTTVTFPATTTAGNSTTYAGMYAAFANGVGKKYVKLTIAPTLKIASFSFAPNPVQGGNSTTGTVVLANPVINAPVRVYLTDNSAKFSMPAYIDIPIGQTTGTFSATTLTTTTTAYAGCYAAFANNVGAKYVKVTITP